ncbi:MAG: hypothetical protein K2Z81_06430, partial [Cyanobacteria bacterium]|nr:hypothetical protein [Cyanobacteriota bacterium]
GHKLKKKKKEKKFKMLAFFRYNNNDIQGQLVVLAEESCAQHIKNFLNVVCKKKKKKFENSKWQP